MKKRGGCFWGRVSFKGQYGNSYMEPYLSPRICKKDNRHNTTDSSVSWHCGISSSVKTGAALKSRHLKSEMEPKITPTLAPENHKDQWRVEPRTRSNQTPKNHKNKLKTTLRTRSNLAPLNQKIEKKLRASTKWMETFKYAILLHSRQQGMSCWDRDLDCYN